MTGKIGDVDAKALFSEGAAEELHDDAVGRNAMEQDDGANFSGGRKIFAFDGQDLHAASGGIHDVALFGVAAAGNVDQSATEKKTENACKSFMRRMSGLQRASSPKMAQERA